LDIDPQTFYIPFEAYQAMLPYEGGKGLDYYYSDTPSVNKIISVDMVQKTKAIE
jgi:hypothetical protein